MVDAAGAVGAKARAGSNLGHFGHQIGSDVRHQSRLVLVESGQTGGWRRQGSLWAQTHRLRLDCCPEEESTGPGQCWSQTAGVASHFQRLGYQSRLDFHRQDWNGWDVGTSMGSKGISSLSGQVNSRGGRPDFGSSFEPNWCCVENRAWVL